MKIRYLLFFVFAIHSSCAQVSQPAMTNDSLSIPPNTIRVNATVTSLTEKTATLKVVTFIGSGQGLINTLSEGQEETVQLPEENLKLKLGEKIQADVKEKMGVDGSQSSYVLVQFKKLQ